MTLDLKASADLDVIYADRGVAATYRHGGSHAVDTSALTEEAVFTDAPVSVIRDARRERRLVAEQRMVEGNRVYRVRASELAEEPAADDELVIGGVTWQVESWELDDFDIEWTLGCRKVN